MIKKILSLVMSILLIIATASFSFSLSSEEVEAAEGDGCCVLGNNAQYCLDGVPKSECNIDDNHDFYPDSSCSTIGVCELGTCVEADGVCSSQKSKKECQEDPKAVWYPGFPSSVDACQEGGCCQLKDGGQAILSFQVSYKSQCEIQANKLQLDYGFSQGECEVVAETVGCCEKVSGCQETTKRQCTGEFHEESCSQLSSVCTCVGNAKLGCEDGDVFRFNSCDEPTDLIKDCILNEEICVEEFGSASCEEITCDIPILYTTLNYDTAFIKAGNVGLQQKSGQSFNQVKADGSVSITLKNSEIACVQYQGPGEGHYAYSCVLGKVEPFNIGNRREEICFFNETVGKVQIKNNEYEQCLSCEDGGATWDNWPGIGWLFKLAEKAGISILDPGWLDYYLVGPGKCDKAETCEGQGDCVQSSEKYCVPKYASDAPNLCTSFTDSESGSPYAGKESLEVGCRSCGACDITKVEKMNVVGSVAICTAQTILGRITSVVTDAFGRAIIDKTGDFEKATKDKNEGEKNFIEKKKGFAGQLRNAGNEIKKMGKDLYKYLNPLRLLKIENPLSNLFGYIYNGLLLETKDYFGYHPEDISNIDFEGIDESLDILDPDGSVAISYVEEEFLGKGKSLSDYKLGIKTMEDGGYIVTGGGSNLKKVAGPLDHDLAEGFKLTPSQLKDLRNYLINLPYSYKVNVRDYYGYKYYPDMVDDSRKNWDVTKESLGDMFKSDRLLEMFVDSLASAGSAIVLGFIVNELLGDKVDINKLSVKYWARWAMCWAAQGVGIPHQACMESKNIMPFVSCFVSSSLNQGKGIVLGSCGYRDWRDPGYDQCYLCNQDPNRECTIERCDGLGKGCEFDNGVCKVKKEILKNCAATKNDPLKIMSGIKDYEIDWTYAYYTVNMTTSKFAECRYTDDPDKEYKERKKFQTSDDAGLHHSTQLYVGDPSNNIYNYYISCKFMCDVELAQYTEPFNSKITITRGEKPDLEPPEIIDYFPRAFQLLESREDVTIWVEGDEDMTCKYGEIDSTADMDSSIDLFSDAAQGMTDDEEISNYLTDNTPFSSLGNPVDPMTCQGDKCEVKKNVESGKEYFYNIICEDPQGNKGASKLIYFKISQDFSVQVTKPKNGLVTSEKIDEIRAATEWKSECKYSFDEKKQYEEMSLFYDTGDNSHVTQLPEPLKSGSYKLFVSCVDFDGLNLATGVSDFTIEPDITPPKLVRINGGNRLRVETDEDTNCTFSEKGFDAEQALMVGEGVIGSGDYYRRHSLYVTDSNVYYLICSDRDGNKAKYTIYL